MGCRGLHGGGLEVSPRFQNPPRWGMQGVDKDFSAFF